MEAYIRIPNENLVQQCSKVNWLLLFCCSETTLYSQETNQLFFKKKKFNALLYCCKSVYINHELNTTIPFIVFLLQNVPKYVRHEENVCSFITITKWILIYIFLDPFMPLYRFCLPTTWYTCKVINVHKFFLSYVIYSFHLYMSVQYNSNILHLPQRKYARCIYSFLSPLSTPAYHY